MPKDNKQEFLTGLSKFEEIMDHHILEMITDDGPVPMDLGSVATHDARRTQSDCDDRVDRIQSWQRSSQERTKRIRGVVPRKGS